MKVLLRDFQNGTFYKHPGSWVDLPSEASDFCRLEPLVPLANRSDTAHLDALVISDNGDPILGIHIPSLPEMIDTLSSASSKTQS